MATYLKSISWRLSRKEFIVGCLYGGAKTFGYQFNFCLSTGKEFIPAMGEINPESGTCLSFRMGNTLRLILFNFFSSLCLVLSSPSCWKGISCLGADSTSCDSILGYCPNFGHISNKFERNGAVTTFTAFMATGWRHFLRWVKDTAVNIQYSCFCH